MKHYLIILLLITPEIAFGASKFSDQWQEYGVFQFDINYVSFCQKLGEHAVDILRVKNEFDVSKTEMIAMMNTRYNGYKDPLILAVIDIAYAEARLGYGGGITGYKVAQKTRKFCFQRWLDEYRSKQ